mmetsp:Transcript_90596/g.253006  ORF Transcript_90596/g.253006 Transcript_90596/m.253006 type:complete len:150 (+) Transcript_90596:104-553(+)
MLGTRARRELAERSCAETRRRRRRARREGEEDGGGAGNPAERTPHSLWPGPEKLSQPAWPTGIASRRSKLLGAGTGRPSALAAAAWAAAACWASAICWGKWLKPAGNCPCKSASNRGALRWYARWALIERQAPRSIQIGESSMAKLCAL